MATEQQLKQALVAAHNAGDSQAAEVIANKIKAMRANADAPDVPEIGSAPELNALSMPALRASYGLLASRGDDESESILKQQFPDATFQQTSKGRLVNLPSGQYYINKEGLSGQDVASFVTDMLAFVPAGRAQTFMGALLGAGATQAGKQLSAQAVGGEGVDPVDVGLAAALGGAGQQAEKAVSAGARLLRGGQTGGVASSLTQQADELGVPLMTSDVIKPQTFATKTALESGEKVPLIGTGGQRAAQQEAREIALGNVLNQYGTPSYQSIVQGLKDQKNRITRAAGNVLQSIGAALDNAGQVPLTNTNRALTEVFDEFSKPGVIQSSPAMEKLMTLADALSSAPQTFTTLKENRTAFRDIINGFDSAERSQLGSRANALLTKLSTAMTDDMTEFARVNLPEPDFNKWKNANAVYAREATKLKSSRIKSILDKGDITPEAAQTMLFSQKPSELKMLYGSLTNEGRAAARTAIIDKVVNNLSRRSSGVTPNSFATELNKFAPQVDVFFKGQEKKQLLGLKKVLDATRRAQDFNVTTPTGQVTLGAGSGLAAFLAPVETASGAITLGTAARIYESKPVRDALIKLAELPPNSAQFNSALTEIRAIMTAAAQAELNREDEQ